MTEDAVEEPQQARRSPWGCALRIAVAAIVLLGLALGATLLGGLLDDSSNPETPSTINAGAAQDYALSDVTYFEDDHVFLVRLADGTFVALYDKSPQQQERLGDCRVTFDENRAPEGAEQLPGFSGAFVEFCDERTTLWSADGLFSSGSGYGNLDRFKTSVDPAGDLIIDISGRTCTRSRGVPGIAPFDETTCGRPD